MWNGRPDGYMIPGAGLEFYSQLLCCRVNICSTHPESDLLPSLVELELGQHLGVLPYCIAFFYQVSPGYHHTFSCISEINGIELPI
jgi:hypothetical protein